MVTLTSVGAASTTTITTTVTVTSMPESKTQENDKKTTAALPASTTSSSEGNGFCQASRAPPGRRTDSLPNVIANIEDREWNQELLPTDGPILGLPDLLGTLDADIKGFIVTSVSSHLKTSLSKSLRRVPELRLIRSKRNELFWG